MVGYFKRQLDFGKIGEDIVSQWLRTQGFTILPVYEKFVDDKMGQRLYLPNSKLIAPDLLAWKSMIPHWVEVKHKTVFTWYRKTGKWQTGIDRKLYQDYLKIAHLKVRWPVWLLFLHEVSVPDEIDKPYCPSECPTGLYGGFLSKLERTIDHVDMRWGNSGMVYWDMENLKKYASLEDLNLQTLAEVERLVQ